MIYTIRRKEKREGPHAREAPALEFGGRQGGERDAESGLIKEARARILQRGRAPPRRHRRAGNPPRATDSKGAGSNYSAELRARKIW